MTVNILAVGDVVGQTGLNILKERLKPLQKEKLPFSQIIMYIRPVMLYNSITT